VRFCDIFALIQRKRVQNRAKETNLQFLSSLAKAEAKISLTSSSISKRARIEGDGNRAGAKIEKLKKRVFLQRFFGELLKRLPRVCASKGNLLEYRQ
jgi:hypothetical protein